MESGDARRQRSVAAHVMCVAAMIAIAAGGAAAEHVVVPLAYDEVRGELGGATILVPGDVACTHQTQVVASQLAPLRAGDRLTGLTFRLYPHGANPPFWPPGGDVTWSDYEITLARAAQPLDSFGADFAANMVDPELVRSGPLTVPQGSFANNPALPPAAPNEWGYELVFDRPYVYGGGDLVLLVAFRGGSAAPLGYMDALFASPQTSAMVRCIQSNVFRAASGGVTRPIILRLTFVPAIPGDLDDDGDVDLSDLTLFLADFGCVGPDCAADINGDGQVGLSDLTILLAHFGS